MATIRKLRGRWQAQVRRRGMAPRAKSFDQKADAEKWARSLESELDRCGMLPDTRVAESTTLRSILERYMIEISPRKRSAHTEISRIKALLRRPLCQRTLALLSTSNLATYRDDRLRTVSPSTVIRELNTISHAIDTAMRDWDDRLDVRRLLGRLRLDVQVKGHGSGLIERNGRRRLKAAYSLDQAVADGHLVPPKAISVPLRIMRSGLRYEDLSDEEKDQWGSLEWGEEEIPDTVDAAEVNQRLFNEDTVDRVIAHLMTNGIKVEGGDRLGKTIVFAKNQAHAEFIERRFNAAYPSLQGHFARVITFKTTYAQSLIDDFSKKNGAPHIAISVDMLDTGIDVPEVVNLVFFKQVRSKTKFWQMTGRGTRLCADLFGPGQDKEFFRVFDYCQNLEFFGASPELKEPGAAKSLSERLFAARLDLACALNRAEPPTEGFGAGEQSPYDAGDAAPSEAEIQADALKTLKQMVGGLNPDNFIVRQNRRVVEKWSGDQAWNHLGDEERTELLDVIAPLPSSQTLGTEEAKRFDLLMFQLELALLRGSQRFTALKKQLIDITAALEAQTGIPAIAQQAVLIEEIQSDPWWEGVTVPLLELVRLRLRGLVQHIEKGRKAVVYSDFADEIGEGVEHELPQVGEVDFARFKAKARHFLKQHEDHIVLHKLRHARALTATDLAELEKMLVDAGIGDAATIERAKDVGHGFGRFVRSLVGLDRQAVNDAFSEFVAPGTATAAQIEFVGLVVEHLTHQGTMDPGLLYEPPFTDIAPTGPEQVFDEPGIGKLFSRIQELNESAVA